MGSMTAILEDEFDLGENMFFVTFCKHLADQANKKVSGISLRFIKCSMLYPTACFAWQGKEVLRLAHTGANRFEVIPLSCNNLPPITSDNAWKRCLKPALLAEISRSMERLKDQKLELLKD